MATAVDIGTLVTKRPEMHGGKPCVAGSGVTVMTIVEMFESGLDPRDIQRNYPHLALEGVLAALTYATANREEIDYWFKVDQDAHDELFGK